MRVARHDPSLPINLTTRTPDRSLRSLVLKSDHHFAEATGPETEFKLSQFGYRWEVGESSVSSTTGEGAQEPGFPSAVAIPCQPRS